MLKKYRNQLIPLIKASGLDPATFKSRDEEIKSYQWFTIQYQDSPLWFRFSATDDSHHHIGYLCTNFNPTFSETAGEIRASEEDEDAFHPFTFWLYDVKEYITERTTPDMWKQLEQQRSLLPSRELGKDDTAPFSEDEKAQLRLSIDEFRLLIEKTFKPTEQEFTLINRRLDYLVERLDKLPRVDWWSLALSTVTSISIALTLDTEKGSILVDLFKQVFSRILQFIPQ